MATLPLAAVVAERACEEDRDRDDRRHSGDAGCSERCSATQGLVHGREQQGTAENRAEDDGGYGHHPPPGGTAADADGSAGLERPERKLRSRH